jgi:hypothetical protein
MLIKEGKNYRSYSINNFCKNKIPIFISKKKFDRIIDILLFVVFHLDLLHNPFSLFCFHEVFKF